MNVEELLELMEETLEAGTAVPFAASKRVVDVDRMRDIIDEVRNNLPDEVRESKKIVNDREQIMKNARIESENIIQQAEERARALVNDQEIVRIAKARSNEMLASTQAKADALRQASSQFCVDALRRTEEAISAALGNVQQAHAAFQGVAGSTAAPAAPTAAPAARQPEIHFEDDAPLDEEVN